MRLERRGARRGGIRAARRGPPCGVPPRAGLPVWRYEIGGIDARKTVLLAALQNTVYVTLSAAVGARPRAAASCARRPFPPARSAGQRASCRRRIMSPPIEERIRNSAATVCHRLRLHGATGQRLGVHDERQTPHRDSLPHRGEPRLRVRGRAVEPRLFPRRPGAGPSGDAVASTEAWDTIRRSRPESALASELQRRERLLAQAAARSAQGMARPSWCWLPISSSSPDDRVADAALAHAAGDECARSSPATTGSPIGAATR